MTSYSLPRFVWVPWSLTQRFVATSTRRVCRKCRKQGEPLDSSPVELLRGGHPRAAVCMARMLVERELVELCRDLPNYNGIGYGRHLADLLLFNRVITTRQYRQFDEIYSAASAVVHGRMLRFTEYELLVDRCLGFVGTLRSLRAPTKPAAPAKIRTPAVIKEPEFREFVVEGFARAAT